MEIEKRSFKRLTIVLALKCQKDCAREFHEFAQIRVEGSGKEAGMG